MNTMMRINRKVHLLDEDQTRVGKATILEAQHQRGYQSRDRVPLMMGETDKFVIDCPELEDWIEEWGNLRFSLDDEAYVIPADYIEPDENEEFWLVEVIPMN